MLIQIEKWLRKAQHCTPAIGTYGFCLKFLLNVFVIYCCWRWWTTIILLCLLLGARCCHQYYGRYRDKFREKRKWTVIYLFDAFDIILVFHVGPRKFLAFDFTQTKCFHWLITIRSGCIALDTQHDPRMTGTYKAEW